VRRGFRSISPGKTLGGGKMILISIAGLTGDGVGAHGRDKCREPAQFGKGGRESGLLRAGELDGIGCRRTQKEEKKKLVAWVAWEAA